MKTFSSEFAKLSNDPSLIVSGIPSELFEGSNNLKLISALGKIK